MKISTQLNNPVFLLIVTILLQSFSFLSIKYSTMESGLTALFLLAIAFGFLGLRAILWQQALRQTELSRIYPYASLVQVLILLYAVILFQEAITTNNVIGLSVMLSGIYFMSRDGARA